MDTSHIELMAPAGSFETLHTAIDAGADSVYLGVANFNMRATAARNFQLSDLEEVVRVCHAKNVRVYVTVNTIMYNLDIEKMRMVVDEVERVGGDSVICADMAAILYAREKNVPVHISTQLSVSNIESLRFYSQFCERIVLARELSLPQIKELADAIQNEKIKGTSGELIELEVFAHGALCVAVSGRCGMSLFASGTSANQGKCSHICRRRFKITDIETQQELVVDNNYVMSAADLCTIGMLDELVSTGINVLKFEGRGRPAEYVDTLIRVYRDALSSLQDGAYTQERIDSWREQLGTVFNRGQSEGLYQGIKFSEWAGLHGSRASEEKVHIGKVQKYYPKSKIAQVLIQAKAEICRGEKFAIIGDATGIVRGVLDDIRLDAPDIKEGSRPVLKAGQNDVITFKLSKKVRPNDKFYIFRKRESLVPRGKEKLIKRKDFHADEEERLNGERHAGIIIFEDQILLMFRKKDGRQYYTLPGGHRRNGEKGEDCCKREIFEETGVGVEDVKLSFEFLNPHQDEREYYYTCSVKSLTKPFLNGEERVRNSEENFYKPLWFDLSEIHSINLLPDCVKGKIESFYSSSTSRSL
jgi:U32 family peptidase